MVDFLMISGLFLKESFAGFKIAESLMFGGICCLCDMNFF
jgi:hypothetical protein